MTESILYIKQQLQFITNPKDIPKAWQDDTRKGVQQVLKVWLKQYENLQKEREQTQALRIIEKEKWAQGYQLVAGIDEVGRGPLAGPVVTACVIMPKETIIPGIKDSKKLTHTKKEQLYQLIQKEAVAIGIGVVDEKVIDDVNIYKATQLAMVEAIKNMPINPDYLLIDAMQLDVTTPQQSIIKGDAKSYVIACASIVAKVTRDRLMKLYAEQYPAYGFDKNAGYGTKEHLHALTTYGITPIHRKSFEPVKSIIQKHEKL